MITIDEQPVKKKRGRPKGCTQSPNVGRKPRQRASDVLGDDPVVVEKQSGGVISAPPSRKPADLALSRVPVPETLLPKREEPGAVPDMIRTVLAIRQTVDLDNPATLFNAMEQYLNLCSQTGMRITNQTLYMACGVGRTDIFNWKHGERRQNNPAYRQFAEMCQLVCAAAREQYGIEGQVNPILTIFHQKAYDGLSDTPRDEEVRDPLGEISDPQKLAEKYKDIPLD